MYRRPEWQHVGFAVLASVVAWMVLVAIDHVLAAVFLGWRP